MHLRRYRGKELIIPHLFVETEKNKNEDYYCPLVSVDDSDELWSVMYLSFYTTINFQNK